MAQRPHELGDFKRVVGHFEARPLNFKLKGYVGWWATPLPPDICTQNDPAPSKNADFDRFQLTMSQP